MPFWQVGYRRSNCCVWNYPNGKRPGRGWDATLTERPLAGGFVEEHFEPLDANDLLASSL